MSQSIQKATSFAAIVAGVAIVFSSLTLVGRAEEARQSKAITFEDLKFAYQEDKPFKREILGEKIEALNGKKVTIRGWMLPAFNLKVKSFVLVRDNFQMSFGPGRSLYDSILVDLKPGETATFSTRPITVEGIFSIREFKIDGKLYAVYHIEASRVKTPEK